MPGKACAECTGCSVCEGSLNPGPWDLETPWVAPDMSMIKVFTAAKREGVHQLRAAIATTGDAFNPNATYRGSSLLTTLCRSSAGSMGECLEVLLAPPSFKGTLDVNLVGEDGVSGLQAAVNADFQDGLVRACLVLVFRLSRNLLNPPSPSLAPRTCC